MMTLVTWEPEGSYANALLHHLLHTCLCLPGDKGRVNWSCFEFPLSSGIICILFTPQCCAQDHEHPGRADTVQDLAGGSNPWNISTCRTQIFKGTWLPLIKFDFGGLGHCCKSMFHSHAHQSQVKIWFKVLQNVTLLKMLPLRNMTYLG